MGIESSSRFYQPVIRLYIIQIGAFIAVWLGSYYPDLDILLSLFYILIISMEIIDIRGIDVKEKLKVLIFWQGPGAILSLMVLGQSIYLISGDIIFIMEFWNTPILPILSLFPAINGQPVYYNLLIATPLIMSLYFLGLIYSEKTKPVNLPVE
ncbi:MAG: hypothetical protein PHD40_00700 [Syntrophomonadaceae bacterium]|nr:hypothetical protein [Syntrophomonadaceae bacterium]